MDDNKNVNEEELKDSELDSISGGTRRNQLVAPTDDECEPEDCACNDDCSETPTDGVEDNKQDINSYE